jgi:hypothetical protein
MIYHLSMSGGNALAPGDGGSSDMLTTRGLGVEEGSDYETRVG